MSFEIGEKIVVYCNNEDRKYVGTLINIALGVNEKDFPTLASIVLRDDVLPEQTYGHVHIFCNEIARIKRYDDWCVCKICGRCIENDWEKHNAFPVRFEGDYCCSDCQVKYVVPIRKYCHWKNIDYNGMYDRVCRYTVKELNKFIEKENKGNPFMG